MAINYSYRFRLPLPLVLLYVRALYRPLLDLGPADEVVLDDVVQGADIVQSLREDQHEQNV